MVQSESSQVREKGKYFEVEFSSFAEHIKFALTREIRDLVVVFARACNEKYRNEMIEMFSFIDRTEKRLAREIKDLEDIRLVMMAIKDLRENEIQYETKITPIEESYNLLQKYEIQISREESDGADTLRYRWDNLHRRAVRSIEFSITRKTDRFLHF